MLAGLRAGAVQKNAIDDIENAFAHDDLLFIA
jgi:hypothetical protein